MRHRNLKKEVNALKELPDELQTRVCKHLSHGVIKQCMLQSKAFFTRIKENYPFWSSKCSTSSEFSNVSEIIEVLKEEKIFSLKWITGKNVSKFTINTGQADSTCLKIYNNKIISSSDDKSVYLFDLSDVIKDHLDVKIKKGGNCGSVIGKKEFKGHLKGVWAFDCSNGVLATGSIDRCIKIWNVDTGSLIATKNAHVSTVRVIKIARDLIVSGGRDGRIMVWDLKGYHVFEMFLHADSVRAMDTYEEFLITGSYDGCVFLWNFTTGKLIRRLLKHSSRVYSVLITENYLISGGQDSMVHVSHRKSKVVYILNLHRDVVAHLAVSYSKTTNEEVYLISAGSDGIVGVFNIETGNLLHKIMLYKVVGAIKVIKNYLLIGCTDVVKLYKIDTGEFVRDFVRNASQIFKIEYENGILAISYKMNNNVLIDCFVF